MMDEVELDFCRHHFWIIFDRKLAAILDRMSGKEILDIGTAREVFTEALYDGVLEELENDRNPEWGRFEIINPSDKAFIEGEFLPCALATLLFSEGKYGLEEVEGGRNMPIFLFGKDNYFRQWFHETFGQDPTEAMKSCGLKIKAALLSVRLEGERTSMNDIVAHAHEQAGRLNEDQEKKGD